MSFIIKTDLATFIINTILRWSFIWVFNQHYY